MALNENTVTRSIRNGSRGNFGESLRKVRSINYTLNEPNLTILRVSVKLESSTNQKRTKYKNGQK